MKQIIQICDVDIMIILITTAFELFFISSDLHKEMLGIMRDERTNSVFEVDIFFPSMRMKY